MSDIRFDIARSYSMKVVGGLLTTFICFAGTACVATDRPAIRWITPDPSEPRKVIVEVTGLSDPAIPSANGQDVLSVHVDPSATETPAMAGTYRVDGATLRFEPRFPLEPGMRYRAVLHSGNGQPLTSTFELPVSKVGKQTAISQVYPSDDVVPENLLKFYVYFSAPMQRGNIYDYIHLRNEQTGKDVELPFLQIDEELWDPSMTRVTLLFDPGRIKRGVTPRVEMGPVLEEGKTYSLIIDRAWKDAMGNELKDRFEKRFAVGAADRTTIDTSKWKIGAPLMGSNRPLTISFGEPLDHALAMRMIRITDESGPVRGHASLEDHERRWSFVPALNWKAGQYKIVVATTIEDLAGNNIGKAFDVDVFEDVQKNIVDESVTLQFDMR